jgi:hypothetical protein
MLIGLLIGLLIGAFVLYEYHKHVTVTQALTTLERDAADVTNNIYTHIADEVKTLERKFGKHISVK